MAVKPIKKTERLPDLLALKEKVKAVTGQVAPVEAPDLREPFEENDLLKAWDEFLQLLKNRGRDSEYTTLNQPMHIEDEAVIRITLANSFQLLTVENIQQELLTYLRQKLRNGSIMLKPDVQKFEEKKLIYTNSEKFEHLAKKYPALRDLKQRFELDTDF